MAEHHTQSATLHAGENAAASPPVADWAALGAAIVAEAERRTDALRAAAAALAAIEPERRP